MKKKDYPAVGSFQLTLLLLLLLLSLYLPSCCGLATPKAPVARTNFIQSTSLELGEIIGKGGFGTVRWGYLLQDDDNTTVVTKAAHKDVKRAESYLKTEAIFNTRLCRSKRNHNIAPYIGECHKDGTTHLVWKPSGNYTLKALLDPPDGGNDALPLLEQDLLGTKSVQPHDLAREVLRQLLSALSQCHAVGIVHRDIKPDNILVDSGSESPSLRLIDFGSAADMASALHRRGFRPQQGVATTLYCAPEQFVDEDHPYAFDVYSAATVWLRLLIPGLRNKNDDTFFQFRCAVRDCGHDLEAWHAQALLEHNSSSTSTNSTCTLPTGWEELLDSSPEGKDAFQLVAALMHYRPEQRPSASEALLSSYLNPACEEPVRPIPPARPWSLTSQMEHWAAEQSEQSIHDTCEIPSWFFDETIE